MQAQKYKKYQIKQLEGAKKIRLIPIFMLDRMCFCLTDVGRWTIEDFFSVLIYNTLMLAIMKVSSLAKR